MKNFVQNSEQRWLALGLISLGLLILFGWKLLLPMFFILPGGAMLYFAFTGERHNSALAIPGMLIAGTGGILFVQALTGYWSSWLYAWTLYGVFLGVGLYIMGWRMSDRSLLGVGRFLTGLSSAAFVGSAALVLFLTMPFLSMLAALLFIGGGLYLLSGRNHKRMLVSHPTPKTQSQSKTQDTSDIGRIIIDVELGDQDKRSA